jgi:predicted nuclease with RNAse H fold
MFDRVVGIDLGASTVHAVALSLDLTVDGRRSVVAADLFDVDRDADGLVGFCRSPHVAIDAPDGLSRAPHLGDSRMGPKFQRARCAEGALGRAHRVWVPWTTPTTEPVPRWMAAGFAVWELLRAAADPIEVYPHAVFWRLAGRQLLHKQTAAGRRARLAALDRVVDLPAFAAAWSHDMIDALAAALVAWHHWNGTAEPVTCAADDPWSDHDRSAIWMPPVE